MVARGALFPMDGPVTDVTGSHLRARDYEVRDIPVSLARQLCRWEHYTRGGSNSATFCHGLVHRETNRTDGAAWWIPPTKDAAAAVFPEGEWTRVLCLHRLVVMPGVPTNGASFLLGRSIRLVRRSGRWDCLVTYADEGEGHTGAIYLATNWEPRGVTARESRWVDPQTGRHVARKAGQKTRRRSEMRALGYEEIEPTRKLRFRMVLR